MSNLYDYTAKRPMGLDPGVGLLAPGVYLKRKYRWTFSAQLNCASTGNAGVGLGAVIPEFYCKSANRPKLEIEELELNFLNQKFWIPGKGAWQSMEITFYDVSVLAPNLTPLWTWIDTIYQIIDDPNGAGGPRGLASINRFQASRPQDYQGYGYLTLYDGCGTWVENWEIPDMWPQNIDLGELDYSSNDEANIVVTFRYAQAAVSFNPDCGGTVTPGCCSPCGSAAGASVGASD